MSSVALCELQKVVTYAEVAVAVLYCQEVGLGAAEKLK